MLGPSTVSCDNEFLAICLLENRKVIQAFQSEHKNTEPQTLRKLLEDAIIIRQQIVLADEKNSEKMRTFQEENGKTFLEFESLREGKIRAHYACVQKENQVRLGLLRANALFIVCRHYSERFSNNMAFLATLKQRINYNFSISLEINKNKMQKTFFSSSTADTDSTINQALIVSNGAPDSARKALRRYSNHSLLISAEALRDAEKERVPRVEVKIADLPDVKPDLTISMPIDFADLIGINLEEYAIMREQATQFLKQQSASVEKDSKEKGDAAREEPLPVKAEPSGMLTNRSPGKEKEKQTSKKPPVGVRFLVGLKKDKSKTKK